jgi:hypothetical protein
MERRREDRRRVDRRERPGMPPDRIPPVDDPAGAMERLVPRKQLRVERGDVVIARESMPRLQPSATAARWWFRVSVYLSPEADGRVFTSFHHAASHGEQLASQRCARLLFIEDQSPTLLNDYRR